MQCTRARVTDISPLTPFPRNLCLKDSHGHKYGNNVMITIPNLQNHT